MGDALRGLQTGWLWAHTVTLSLQSQLWPLRAALEQQWAAVGTWVLLLETLSHSQVLYEALASDKAPRQRQSLSHPARLGLTLQSLF